MLCGRDDRFQAGKIFAEMVAIITQQPGDRGPASTSSGSGRNRGVGRARHGGSIFAALSSDAATKLGLSPKLHPWSTSWAMRRKRDLYDALDSAMGARDNPLLIAISTQAPDDNHIFIRVESITG